MRKRIISFMLILLMILTSVPLEAFGYQGKNVYSNKETEVKYNIVNVNGQKYKAYKISDIMPNNLVENNIKKSTFNSVFMRATGYVDQTESDPNKLWTLKINWETKDIDFPDKTIIFPVIYNPDGEENSGDEIELGIFEVDAAHAKKGNTNERITMKVNEGINPNDYIDGAEVLCPQFIKYDLRIFKNNEWNGHEHQTYQFLANISQNVMSVYKISWFDNDNSKRQEFTGRWKGSKSIETDLVGSTEDGYYTVIKELVGRDDFYTGNKSDEPYQPTEKYMVKSLKKGYKEEPIEPVRLNIDDVTPVETAGSYIRKDGVETQKGFLQLGTKYYYNITGDYRTLHEIELREALNVKFDPNGAKFDQVVKTEQPIGHSMKIGEAFGDLEAVKVPTKDQITNIPQKDNKDQEFKGWTLTPLKDDKKTPYTYEELKAAKAIIYPYDENSAKAKAIKDKETALTSAKTELDSKNEDFRKAKTNFDLKNVTNTSLQSDSTVSEGTKKIVKQAYEEAKKELEKAKKAYNTAKQAYDEKAADLKAETADVISYQVITKDNTTFYAVYGPKDQGKVNVKYLDENNKPISEDYRFLTDEEKKNITAEKTEEKLLDEKYPASMSDNLGKKILAPTYSGENDKVETKATDTETDPNKKSYIATRDNAPKFVGYEVKKVEVEKKNGAAADYNPQFGPTKDDQNQEITDATKFDTIKYVYKKLDPIIPEKKNGQDNPEVTQDIKDTYVKVTFTNGVENKKFGKLYLGNTVPTEDNKLIESISYYVNPKEKKTIENVKANENVNVKVTDATKKANETAPWIDNKSAKIELTKEITDADKKDGITVNANYDDKGKGEANIRYVVKDSSGTKTAIDAKFQAEDASKYPPTIPGTLDTNVLDYANKTKNENFEAPKFVGYTYDSAELKDNNSNFVDSTSNDKATLDLVYTKVAEIIEKKDGTKIPDGYVDITFKNAEKNNEKLSKLNNAEKDVVYSINPKAGVKISEKTPFNLVGKDDKGDELKKAVPTVTVAKDGYKVIDHKKGEESTGWNYDNYDLVGQALTEAKTFTAQVEQKGEGKATLKFVDDKNTELKPLDANSPLYIESEKTKYSPELKGKDGTDIKFTRADAPKLRGYELVEDTQNPISKSAEKFSETTDVVITLKYKKLDDIIKPSTPSDEKPAGYVTVKFLSDAEDVQNPHGKLWLKDGTQTEAPNEEAKLFTELVYYVNPINATLDLEANKLSGKKANGTDDINVEVYAKVTDGKSKVKLNDSSKYDWNKNPADAIGTDKKVKKDVTLTVQYGGLKIAEIIKKENLAPVTLKVWVGDTIPWKDGVKVADTLKDQALKTAIEGYLNDAKTSYNDNSNPSRTSNEEAVNTPKKGTIRVTFSDKSYIDVENQDLYVIPHITSSTNNNTPDGAIEVTFKLGEGVKAGTKTGAATPVEYGKYKVKPNTNLDTYKLKIANTEATIFQHINAQVTETTKYTGVVWEGQTANKPNDHVVTKDNNVFTAKAAKIFNVTHVFKGIDADQQGTPEIDANNLPDELKAGANSLIPDKKPVVENGSYTPDNITTKVTQIIKDNQGEVTTVYEWTFKEWDPDKIENISEDKTVTGTWERRQAKSEVPTVNPVKPGDKEITGKGEPGSDIVVELPDGSKVPGKVDEHGDWKVEVPKDKPLKDKDVIKVTQTEKGKKPSDPVKIIVGEEPGPAPQPEQPPMPDYNPWWPIWFGSTTTEVKKEEPKHLERHDAYIAGYPDGTVRPDGKITRAEVSAIFARLTENSAPANYSPKFSDVLAYDWFCDSVMKLSNKDIIKGYPDGTFKPNKSITRAEFAVIASKYIKNPKAADETFSDVPMNHWAKDAIAMVKAEGWISGYTDGTFKPDAPITRAEAVSIVNRMFDRAADGEFVREHGFEITSFGDLNTNHWAYYEIIEATHSHDYERIDKRTERWEKIVK